MHPLNLEAFYLPALLFIVNGKQQRHAFWQLFADVPANNKRNDNTGSDRACLYRILTKNYNRMVKNYRPLPLLISNFDSAKTPVTIYKTDQNAFRFGLYNLTKVLF